MTATRRGEISIHFGKRGKRVKRSSSGNVASPEKMSVRGGDQNDKYLLPKGYRKMRETGVHVVMGITLAS